MQSFCGIRISPFDLCLVIVLLKVTVSQRVRRTYSSDLTGIRIFQSLVVTF